MKTYPSYAVLTKVTSLSSLTVGLAMILLAFTQGRSVALVLGAVGVVTVLVGHFSTSAIRFFLTRYERQFDEQGAYFTPRLAYADQQLQALAVRIAGSYQRGAIDWPSFAKNPSALTSTPDNAPEPVWGEGSVVRVILQGLKIEVTYGVQPVSTGERGLVAQGQWFVLAPGLTISAATESARPRWNRFNANWSADEENAMGPDRLRHFLVRTAATAAGRLPMPPAVANARQPLSQVASTIALNADRVFVVGRAPAREPKVSRDFGQGDFGVESLVDLVERSVAFVRALERN